MDTGLVAGRTYNTIMFSIRGLFSLTLFFACVTALGQLGALGDVDGRLIFEVVLAVVLHLLAFLSILTWIREIEQLRCGGRRSLVLFADVTAFLMFAGQLFMACRVFGVNLLSG